MHEGKTDARGSHFFQQTKIAWASSYLVAYVIPASSRSYELSDGSIELMKRSHIREQLFIVFALNMPSRQSEAIFQFSETCFFSVFLN